MNESDHIMNLIVDHVMDTIPVTMTSIKGAISASNGSPRLPSQREAGNGTSDTANDNRHSQGNRLREKTDRLPMTVGIVKC